jgi:hypothetical protein
MWRKLFRSSETAVTVTPHILDVQETSLHTVFLLANFTLGGWLYHRFTLSLRDVEDRDDSRAGVSTSGGPSTKTGRDDSCVPPSNGCCVRARLTCDAVVQPERPRATMLLVCPPSALT